MCLKEYLLFQDTNECGKTLVFDLKQKVAAAGFVKFKALYQKSF